MRRGSRRYNVTVILAALAAAIVIAIVAATRQEETPPEAPPVATPVPTAARTIPSAAPSPARQSSRPSPTPAPPLRAAFTHPDPASLRRASVVDVVDGDTIDVVIGGMEERVRLYGVDTPERGDRCFFEAAARTEALTRGGVLLESGPRARDRYGRLLAYVYTPDGASVDAQLIAEGLGTAWRQDGQHRDAFVALETSARATGTGCLWGR